MSRRPRKRATAAQQKARTRWLAALAKEGVVPSEEGVQRVLWELEDEPGLVAALDALVRSLTFILTAFGEDVRQLRKMCRRVDALVKARGERRRKHRGAPRRKPA